LAALILAKGDADALLKHVFVSQADWRDTLVAAGMASLETWRKVASAAGFKVPAGDAA